MLALSIQAAAKTESSGSPVFLFVFAALIAAVVVFAVIRNRNTTTAKETGVQVQGFVVASRVRAHVNAPYEGILGVSAGVHDVRHNENGTTVTRAAGAAAGIGPDGRPTAAVGAGIEIGRGWDPLHNYDADKVNYDVTLSIEYTDPSTGKTKRIQQKSGMGELVRNLPFESRVLSHVSFVNIINPFDMADGFIALRQAAQEAKRLNSEGASADDITDHFTSLNDNDQGEFVRLSTPVPVALWVDETKPRDERYEYEFSK